MEIDGCLFGTGSRRSFRKLLPLIRWPLTKVPLYIFGPPEGGSILFLLSPEVSGTSGTMSIYICQQHGGREVGT